MVGFYSSIIFIGIILIVISLIWIVFDKKNAFDTELRMDEKKAELIRIISDAEMMVQELNKFSDYIVTQIGEKNAEMDTRFREADKLIETMRVESTSFHNLRNVVMTNDHSIETSPKFIEVNPLKKRHGESEKPNEKVTNSSKDMKGVSKVKEKIISINNKHNEVITLANKGLNETEIARKLNMGKGEIQLILGVNR
ncbi:MAG: hypothetical protein GX270_13075 [Clostridiaceae bacterium]|nr:hypothetical protein [Clostridiaceae bacterium]